MEICAICGCFDCLRDTYILKSHAQIKKAIFADTLKGNVVVLPKVCLIVTLLMYEMGFMNQLPCIDFEDTEQNA